LLYFQVEIRVHLPTEEPTFGRSRRPLLNVYGWLLVAWNLVTIDH